MRVRSYFPKDYPMLKDLYMQKNLYGGEYSEFRDSEDKLNSKIAEDPMAILVAEENGKIIGTVSLIEDGRVAWLYRFIATFDDVGKEAKTALFTVASAELKSRGHEELLVYAEPNNENIEDSLVSLGLIKGGNYDCYWREL